MSATKSIDHSRCPNAIHGWADSLACDDRPETGDVRPSLADGRGVSVPYGCGQLSHDFEASSRPCTTNILLCHRGRTGEVDMDCGRGVSVPYGCCPLEQSHEFETSSRPCTTNSLPCHRCRTGAVIGGCSDGRGGVHVCGSSSSLPDGSVGLVRDAQFVADNGDGCRVVSDIGSGIAIHESVDATVRNSDCATALMIEGISNRTAGDTVNRAMIDTTYDMTLTLTLTGERVASLQMPLLRDVGRSTASPSRHEVTADSVMRLRGGAGERTNSVVDTDSAIRRPLREVVPVPVTTTDVYVINMQDRVLLGRNMYVPLACLDIYFEFHIAFRDVMHLWKAGIIPYNDILIIDGLLSDILIGYTLFSKGQLLSMAKLFGVTLPEYVTKESLLNGLCAHAACSGPTAVYVFKALPKGRLSRRDGPVKGAVKKAGGTARPRIGRQPVMQLAARVADPLADAILPEQEVVPNDFPPAHDESQVNDIIREFQDHLSLERLRDCVCGCCAELVEASVAASVSVWDVDFSLLRNVYIPADLLPTSYNLAAYDYAILHPSGLSCLYARDGYIVLCVKCKACLVQRHSMPALALANFFYYAHDMVPPDVQAAFKRCSFVDRRLVARCGANKVCFRYMDNPESNVYKRPFQGSQRYSRGNVIILPLDNMVINNLLPPSLEDVKESFVAVFVGNERPTADVLRQVGAFKASAGNVKLIIDFLLSRNPAYTAVTDEFPLPAKFSIANFESLFGSDPVPGCEETVILPCVEIGHVQPDDAQEGVMSDVASRNEYDNVPVVPGEFLMEACGYVCGDRDDVNYKSMKSTALAHSLAKKPFLLTKKGNCSVHDFKNPYTLTWLFPHLDPFGLGGFEDRRRMKPVSMEKQLAHLLRMADGSFREDATFAFVYHNVGQKRTIMKEVRFRVPFGAHEKIVQGIRDTPINVLTDLAARLQQDRWTKPENEQEDRVLKVLNKIQMIRWDMPGSDAYKRCRRNEIRALINFVGVPAFFITITPDDIDSLLVNLSMNRFEDAADIMKGTSDKSRMGRAMAVAKNPAVAARVFHQTVRRFIDIVLRPGGGKGLFGECTAMYGMVEAQGRGTLHIHMLVWLRGNPSPLKLRERLVGDPEFKTRMFAWLERHIKTELPGTKDIVSEGGAPLPKPRLEEGEIDARSIQGPLIRDLPCDEFRRQFDVRVSDLVKRVNWHVHKHSCWIHLQPGEPRTDDTCRMRIDGKTRLRTELDEESGSILLRRLHPRINEYNDVIMFLLKCNMDIQYIGSGEEAKAALYYITDYITKPSLKVHVGLSALIYAIQKNEEKFQGMTAVDDAEVSRSLVNKMGNAMMARQEMSHQQIMSQYVGGGDVYTTHQFRVLQWGAFYRHVNGVLGLQPPSDSGSYRADTSVESTDDVAGEVSLADLNLTVSETEVTASSQVQDYIYRPEHSTFECLCLYDFVCCVKSERKTNRKKQRDAVFSQDERDSDEFVEQDLSHPYEVGDEDANKDGSDVDEARPDDADQSLTGDFMRAHSQFSTHRLRFQSKFCVPVVLGPTLRKHKEDDQDSELWYKGMVILFSPWRRAAGLLAGHCSWQSRFESVAFSSFHLQVMENMDVLNQCKDARDNHMMRRERRGDTSRLIHMNGESMTLELFEEGVLMDDALDPDGHVLRDDLRNEDGDISAQLLSEAWDRDTSAVVGEIRVLSSLVQDDQSRRIDSSDDTDMTTREVHADDEAELKLLRQLMAKWRKDKRPQPPVSAHHVIPTPRPPESRITTLQGYSESTASACGPDDTVSEVDAVIDEMGMRENVEQCRVLRIVGDHATTADPKQLFLYVGGVGGTGKSHVIRAIVRLFAKLGKEGSLLLSAPTGSAAILIGGYTIHALVLLPLKRTSKANVSTLDSIWRGVHYLVIDEISMVSAAFLSEISHRICLAKGTADGIPFGGVNIIYSGDFGQLRPFSAFPLFHHRLVANVSLRTGQKLDGQSALNGAFIWRQLNAVVLLRRNMRQLADVAWANLLARVRCGNAWNGRSLRTEDQNGGEQNYLVSDYEVLLGRQLSVLCVADARDNIKKFRDAPVVVSTRKVRDAVNVTLAKQHASRLGVRYREYCAEDSFKGNRLTGELQERILHVPSRVTSDFLGRLPLFVGMRVMVTENIAISKNIVNGATGTVVGIRHKPGDFGARHAVAVFVHLPGCGVQQPGMDHDTVSIFPERTTFKYTVTLEDSVTVACKVSRSQVPLVPAYSFTDYKSQGKSLPAAIVDLAGCFSLQSMYVMLSRVPSLEGLAVARWFPSSKLEKALQSDQRNEFARLERLDRQTNIGHSDQTTGYCLDALESEF